ncbi:MAG: HAMP domain-containing sensor histidine kinase [Myxococcota bacterium]
MNPLLRTLTELHVECAVFDEHGALSWISPCAAQRFDGMALGQPSPQRWALLIEAVCATARDGQARGIHIPPARLARYEDEVLVIFASPSTTELEMFAAASAQLAHDMRNPMAGVMSALTVLSTRLEKEEQDIAEHMKQSLEGLSRLVDQLLLFSRPVVPMSGQADIEPVVSAAFRDVRRQHPELRLQAKLGEITVPGDSRLLRHCFRNLIANAAQMMPDGGSVWVEGEVSERRLSVGFEDEGPGVDPAVLPRIFEPFYSTRSSGHGLGLTVAARIAEAHGGRLAAAPGRLGARFTVELPAPH